MARPSSILRQKMFGISKRVHHYSSNAVNTPLLLIKCHTLMHCSIKTTITEPFIQNSSLVDPIAIYPAFFNSKEYYRKQS